MMIAGTMGVVIYGHCQMRVEFVSGAKAESSYFSGKCAGGSRKNLTISATGWDAK